METPPSTAEASDATAVRDAAFQRALEAEKLEAMAEFAAGAGHEINNPLTVISGRAQLLLRDEADPERRHALALISAQAMRVYEMIADMMLFARPPRPEFERVEVVKLVDDLVAELAPRAAAQETAFCRVGKSEPAFVEADPVQLGVAIRAICQNSFEALQTGGQVEIAVEIKASGVFSSLPSPVGNDSKQRLPTPLSVGPLSVGGEVRIVVRDDGPGLKPEERRHAFDPFYSARQAGRGLGLGLSKAWRIVVNHGGRIDLESSPGRGAVVTVVLRSIAP